ncbi:MAG: hypothetical protein H7343_00465, partial [Undibacterium sp.]|nr:hypothetical protein [Opitutaceae bacterium]
MKRFSSLLALWLLCACASVSSAGENSGLAHARRAQVLLGADVWSQVISVQNTGRTAHYPRTVHALVFELAGVLWFYTDTDGTQSFSTHRGRLEGDKADFAPLLRDVHRGFSSWTVVPADFTSRATETDRLLNGCFIESVANLRQRLLIGGAVTRPQLLSYYAGAGNHVAGHTVLTYETAAGIRVIDPVDPSRPMLYPREFARNAATLSTALVGRLIEKAVWIPVNDFASTLAARYA